MPWIIQSSIKSSHIHIDSTLIKKFRFRVCWYMQLCMAGLAQHYHEHSLCHGVVLYCSDFHFYLNYLRYDVSSAIQCCPILNLYRKSSYFTSNVPGFLLSSDRSCARGMIHNKIHPIRPGFLRPSIALTVQNRGLKDQSFDFLAFCILHMSESCALFAYNSSLPCEAEIHKTWISYIYAKSSFLASVMSSFIKILFSVFVFCLTCSLVFNCYGRN